MQIMSLTLHIRQRTRRIFIYSVHHKVTEGNMVVKRLTGQYLNAEGVRQDGVFWRIVSQPELEHSDEYNNDRYAQDVVTMKDNKTQKRYSMNATSSNKVLDVLGENEANWLNALVEVELKNEKVFGKIQDTVYVKNVWPNGKHPTNVDFSKNPYAVVTAPPTTSAPVPATQGTTVNMTPAPTAPDKNDEIIKKNVEQIKVILLSLHNTIPQAKALTEVLNTGDLKSFWLSFENVAKTDKVIESFTGTMKTLLPVEAWTSK